MKLSSRAVVMLEMRPMRDAKRRSLLPGANGASEDPSEIGERREKDTPAPGFSAVLRGGLGKHLSNARADRQD